MKSIHDENCDVNDFNLEGIKKPCNCGAEMTTDHSVLEEKNREHLRAAIAGKCYTTERDSVFYKNYWIRS